MAVDIGKIFEKELEKVFRSLEESHVLGWHRFPDTGSAGGNIIAEQPSDYLLALPAGSLSPHAGQRFVLAEAKASEKKSSLSKASMRPSQRRAISVYRLLLQLPYLVIFWDATEGVMQVWDGAGVVDEARINPRFILFQADDVGSGLKLRTAVVAAHFVDWLKLPPKSVTLAAFNNL
jgi:hypothetical protein